MLLDIAKQADVSRDQAACWRLVGDAPRLSGCIPGVSDVREVQPGRYTALVTDKLGPFRVQIPVEITIQSIEEPNRLAADLSGSDGRGQARVKGKLEALLEPAGDGTKLSLNAHLEVLGKLATLGATPMRRRADEIFTEFVRRITQELAG